MDYREELAHKYYGQKYSSLSAWAQADVDSRVFGFTQPRADTTTLNDVNSKAEEERKTARIRVLEEENEDLWLENTELKGQMEELRNQLNLPPDDTL